MDPPCFSLGFREANLKYSHFPFHFFSLIMSLDTASTLPWQRANGSARDIMADPLTALMYAVQIVKMKMKQRASLCGRRTCYRKFISLSQYNAIADEAGLSYATSVDKLIAKGDRSCETASEVNLVNDTYNHRVNAGNQAGIGKNSIGQSSNSSLRKSPGKFSRQSPVLHLTPPSDKTRGISSCIDSSLEVALLVKASEPVKCCGPIMTRNMALYENGENIPRAAYTFCALYDENHNSKIDDEKKIHYAEIMDLLRWAVIEDTN
ncbi:hypothetical protein NC651_011691 [Populus alba x Populus x berolinensis]|nr:hypothetical protein NC651_011691 [Populus alba x Populus x berolinensis]